METIEVKTPFVEVRVKQDESSHWYVIPADKEEEFDSLHERSIDGDTQAQDDFIVKFSQYMTGGGINNVQLFTKTRFFEEGN